MPMSKWRRAFWWYRNLFALSVPIVGGVAAYFVDAPWGTPVVIGAFGFIIGTSTVQFFQRVDLGPRPHKSILMDDHRT